MHSLSAVNVITVTHCEDEIFTTRQDIDSDLTLLSLTSQGKHRAILQLRDEPKAKPGVAVALGDPIDIVGHSATTQNIEGEVICRSPSLH